MSQVVAKRRRRQARLKNGRKLTRIERVEARQKKQKR